MQYCSIVSLLQQAAHVGRTPRRTDNAIPLDRFTDNGRWN